MQPPLLLPLTRLRTALLLSLSLGLLALVPTGCGGGQTTSVISGATDPTNPTGTGGPTVDSSAAFESFSRFTLQPTLKTLPQDGSVRISAVTDDSVTLSGPVPLLAPGDALLSNDTLPDGTFGLIRQVVSVDQSGGDTVVRTQPGDLADVFQTADIHQMESFPAAAFEKMSPGTEGISFGTPVRSRSVGSGRAERVIASLPITFRNVHLQAPDGTVIAELNGQVSLEAGMETLLKLDSIGVGSLSVPTGVRSLILAPYTRVTGKVRVRTRVKGAFSKRITISDPANPVEYNFGIGPVALNTKLTLFAQVDGDFDGTGDVTLDGGVFLSAGLGGGEAIEKSVNEFGSYSAYDPYFKMSTDGIYPRSTLHLNASLLQPEAQLNLAGLGGVSARLDALRGKATFTYKYDPNKGGNVFSYVLDGNVRGTLGGKLRLLGLVTVFDGEREILNKSFRLTSYSVRDTGQTTAPASLPGESAGSGAGDIGITLR